MALKTVVNSDSGTADLVGGNDWDNLATAVNLGEDYKYLVVASGGTYYVKNSVGEVAHSGTNPTTEIQYAFDNLTVGRTYQEKVLLKGDFVIPSTILMPSYIDIELQGRMKLANTVNDSILANASLTATPASQNTNISIHGGEWDGNNANNVLGTGNSFISFETARNIDCRDMYIHDAKYGIIFEGCTNVRCHNIQGKTFTKMLLISDASATYGVGCRNTLYTQCIAEDCAINGLYGHGNPSGQDGYGLSVVNCIAFDCDFGGIYLDEKLWGIECVGNFVYQNGDGSTAGAGIWINGEQDGIPYFSSRWNTCIGNVCFQNNNDGIELTKAAYVLVSNNVLVENEWNGLFGIGIHHCMIKDNMVVNNSQHTAGSWMGIDLTSVTGPDSVLYPVHDNMISGNMCTDNQGTKTQQYGIQIRSTTTAYNNIITDNDVRGNRAGQNAGINSGDLSNCYDNLGFRTKRGKYNAIHPTDSAMGILQGTISTFTNGATATIAKTIDSTGCHMTFTTHNTTNDTCGAKVTKFTERDLQPVLKCKFKHPSGSLTRMFIGFHSNADTSLTTVASILANYSGFGLFIDGQASANYRLLTNDGSASSTNTDSTVAFDTNVHELQILSDNGSGVLFVLDDTLLTGAKITTGVPAVGTDLGAYWAIMTQTTAQKVMDIWDVEVNMKD